MGNEENYNTMTIEELHQELMKQHELFLQYTRERNHQLKQQASDSISMLLNELRNKLQSEE
ncbi:MAG TPA: hypothetical protein VMT76_07905 [Puia sp.]|nr:hypothetical protein [Puia sp.]